MKSPIRNFTAALLVTGLIAAVPAQAEPFNGPSVGVQAGWSQNKVGTLDGDLGIVELDRSRDSFTGGVYAGYDYKLGSNVVIGAEAAFNVAAKDRIVTHGAVDTIFNPRHAFDLSVRAGYLVNDKSLIYVRGGYDNLLARTTLIDADGAVSSKESYDGWLVGGGVERALGDKLSTRLEYRYSDLGSGASKFDRHQVLLGVAYRF